MIECSYCWNPIDVENQLAYEARFYMEGRRGYQHYFCMKCLDIHLRAYTTGIAISSMFIRCYECGNFESVDEITMVRGNAEKELAICKACLEKLLAK